LLLMDESCEWMICWRWRRRRILLWWRIENGGVEGGQRGGA
jgi:hypothetical protein